MSQLFTPVGQSIGASALASVLPVNIQDWFPLGLTGLISLQPKGLSRVFSKNHSSKASILWHSAFVMVQLSHPYMTAGKTIPLTIWTFVAKVMSLLLKRLSSFVIGFLPILNKCSNRDVKEWTIKLQLWVNFQEVTGDSNRSSPVHYLCDSGCAHLTPL